MSEFYMGCDVSKGYGDFIVLNKKKQPLEKAFQLDDTFEGHNAFTTYLENFFKEHPGSTLSIGVESTGGYEDNWYVLFLRLEKMYPLKVAHINPFAVRKHHEASLKRNVTDEVSAENIASYMISYSEKINYDNDFTFKDLQKQCSLIKLLQKQQTQLSNHLEKLLYHSHPSLIQYCKKGIPTWLLEILTHYPTAKKLSRARVDKVSKISHVTIEKAEKLIESAGKSVASYTSETDAMMIRHLVFQIQNIDILIGENKDNLVKTCNLPEVKLLCTFKGISEYSAIVLLVNIVTIARFSSVKKLASYFGLHPVYKQSGDGSWGFHMSKKGRKQPRAILFLIAMSAIQWNPIIKQLYTKCLDSDMCSMEALGVCMHKILRIVYGMLKNNTEFRPEIDEKNKKSKLKRKTKKDKKETKRRYQKHDNTAPISRRQSKKREKKNESLPQKNDVLMNGVKKALNLENNNRTSKMQNDDDVPKKINEIVDRIVEELELTIK
jgi:transposase